MARKVGSGSKRVRSTAKRDAQKTPTVRMLPKAKHDYVIDDRPSQRSKRRPDSCAVDMSKGRYESIPGTRLQQTAGGKHVRVIIQDSKTFEPSNVRGARRHIAKLAEEAAELARIRGTEAEASAAAAAAAAAAKAAGVRRSVLVKRKQQQEASAPQVSKKAKKAEEKQDRQAKSAQVHEEAVAAENRQLVSDTLLLGEVVERRPGQALVQLHSSAEAQLPKELLAKLRQRSMVPSSEASACVLPLRFGDAKGVNLQKGVKLRFRVFSSSTSDAIGACDAEAQAPESPVASPKAKAKAKAKGKAKAEAKAQAGAKEAALPKEQGRAARAAARGERKQLLEAKAKRTAQLVQRDAEKKAATAKAAQGAMPPPAEAAPAAEAVEAGPAVEATVTATPGAEAVAAGPAVEATVTAAPGAEAVEAGPAVEATLTAAPGAEAVEAGPAVEATVTAGEAHGEPDSSSA